MRFIRLVRTVPDMLLSFTDAIFKNMLEAGMMNGLSCVTKIIEKSPVNCYKILKIDVLSEGNCER